ncbi:hypothetical protein LCGC14_0742060, partial [marine sediment metagenome]
NISESFLYNHGLRKKHAEQYQLTQKNIEKIKRIAFKKILYPEYKEAYDYIRNLGNIFEHSKEFANARNAYRKRINK